MKTDNWRFAQLKLLAGFKLMNFSATWEETHAYRINGSIIAYS